MSKMGIWPRNRMILSKIFGVFFAALTLFSVGYWGWIVVYQQEPGYLYIGRLISRGFDVFVFAFITYIIHAEIRSQSRFRADSGLYSAVQQKIDEDLDPDKTRRVDLG